MKSRLFNFIAILFLCSILAGCGKVKIDWVDENADKSNSDFASVVEDTLEDSNKEECLYLYRFYSGLAEYVTVNAEAIGTTDQLEPLIQKVHKQNKWLDSDLESKDEDFSKALREELMARGFEDPKSLNDVETRDSLVKVLNETAEGAYEAYKSK